MRKNTSGTRAAKGRKAHRLIYGSPQSKANSRRIIRKKIKGRLRTLSIKSAAALAYAQMFRQQCRAEPELLVGDIHFMVKIWYRSWQSDLDESLIMDLCQGLLYDNDRQIKHKYIHHMGVDPIEPRCEITVWETTTDDPDLFGPK